MTKRPARRTTNLSNPLVPQAVEAAQPPNIDEDRQEAAKKTGTGEGWTRTSFKHTIEEGRRARGAWFYTQTELGIRPYWQFVEEAVNEKVARLEAEYNDGRPFPDLDAVTPGPKPGIATH